MHPAHIFDTVLARVREYQVTCHAKAINPAEHTGGGLPRVGNVCAEYVADFERAGRRVLADNPNRLTVFIVYYCQAVPFKQAIALTQLREPTFKSHMQRLKTPVGRELLRVGLYPPRRYHERSSQKLTAEEMNCD